MTVNDNSFSVISRACPPLLSRAVRLLATAGVVFLGFGDAPVRALERPEIRTEFENIKTGMTAGRFIELRPDFKMVEENTFLEFEKKGKENPRVYKLKRPGAADFLDNVVGLIPVQIMRISGGDPNAIQCDDVVEAVFLSSPPFTEEMTDRRTELYSFDYIACDSTKTLSAARVLDNYVDKYGLYQDTDPERSFIIYNAVKNRFQVRVREVTGGKDDRGILISVVDEEMFKEYYRLWRSYVRSVEYRFKKKF